MGFLVIRKSEITKIHLSEVGMVIVESTAVSLIAALLAEMTKRRNKANI